MDVDLINIMSIAYLGDAIYEVYVREYLLKQGISKVDELQKHSIRYVSARSQCKILEFLINNNLLTDNELDIVKRGRNYKRANHPRNTDIITYKMSSGFEAMIGYLYLNSNSGRLDEIMNYILGGNYEENN